MKKPLLIFSLTLTLGSPARADIAAILNTVAAHGTETALALASITGSSAAGLAARWWTASRDVKRLDKLIADNLPKFEKEMEDVDRAFSRLSEVHKELKSLKEALPPEWHGQQLDELVRREGFERLGTMPNLGPSWVARYRKMRDDERQAKQELVTAWNGLIQRAQTVVKTELTDLSPGEAEKFHTLLQKELSAMSELKLLADPTGNEPLGKVGRMTDGQAEMISLNGLYKGEFPRLRETCNSLMSNLRAQGVRSGIQQRTVSRTKIAAASLGGVSFTLGGVWAYLKFGADVQAPHAPIPATPPVTVPPAATDAKDPVVAMPGVPAVPPKFGPPIVPDKPIVKKDPTVVDKAGTTTEDISKRRNPPPSSPTEDITKKRRN